MTLADIRKKWLDLVNLANSKGLPLPTIRDPKTGMGSISLTLVVLSFNIWVASIIGKVASDAGGINPDQTLNMFLACAGLYFGRKFQRDGNKVDFTSLPPVEDKKEDSTNG